MLLQTHFLIHSHLGVALVAQRPALILDEAQVRQLLVAHLAAEALRVPGRAHGLKASYVDVKCQYCDDSCDQGMH